MESTNFLYLGLGLASLLAAIKHFFFPSTSTSTSKPLPPGPLAFPIIGNLHLFRKPLYKCLARFAEQYGPAYLLRFGSRPVLVVSNLAHAQECLQKNDVNFAFRPQLHSSEDVTYNHLTVASSHYGSHWRNIRHLIAVELLANAPLQQLADIRADEVHSLLTNLFKENPNPHQFERVKLKPRFFGIALNVLMRMIAGKRYYGEVADETEEAKKFRDIVEEVHARLGATNVSDFMPILRWIDFGGVRRTMKDLQKRKNAILQNLVDEARRKGDYLRTDKKKKTLIETMLYLQQEAPEYYSDAMIKAQVHSLVLAGTDTSTDTMEWAMTYLLNNPEAIEKARAEIDAHVETSRLVNEDDLVNLPYIYGIINETLRMSPVGPLLAPHEATYDCTVGGYHIPAGTMLLIHAWKIHRDPAIWEEPLKYRPDRFLEGEWVVNKTLPFGMGRRRCPGEALAYRVMALTLATVIQCFEMKRVGEELVPMTEKGGLTVSKIEHLEVMYKPRKVMVNALSQLVN